MNTPTPAAFPAKMDLSEGERLLADLAAIEGVTEAFTPTTTTAVANFGFRQLRDAEIALRAWVSTNLPALLSAARERDALREALRIAEEVLAMSERPSFEDPRHKDEIAALGDRIGFGALMSSASATWRTRIGGSGGEFVCGPCHVTVLNALTTIRTALATVNREQSEGAVGK